jgi:peptidyl-tRNA hydrolase, PTH1 family
MNISGPSIAAVARHAGVNPASLVVISDSLSHKVNTLNVRMGGSAEGHNGVKSIISALGNENNFWRFRVGIGRDQTDPAVYVLQKIPQRELQFWSGEEGLGLFTSALEQVALKAG